MRTNTVTLAWGKDLSRNEPSFIFSRYFSLAFSLFSLCKSLTNSTGRDERRKICCCMCRYRSVEERTFNPLTEYLIIL